MQLGGPATLAPGGLPRTDEVALGWRGRPGRGLEGGVEARWRRTSGLWTEQETGLLTDERGQWTSADGAWTSRRTLPPTGGPGGSALGARGLGARARTGPARVVGGLEPRALTGTAAGPFDPWLADPAPPRSPPGPLPDDQRHRVRLSLALLAHPAVELGARLRYATGGPLWETFSVPGSAGLRTVRETRGTGVLGSVQVGAARPGRVHRRRMDPRSRLGTLFPGALPRLDLTLEAAQVAGGTLRSTSPQARRRLGAVLRREPPFQLVLGLRAGE